MTSRHYDINRLVQERRNSSALAMELRVSCTNPPAWCNYITTQPVLSETFTTDTPS